MQAPKSFIQLTRRPPYQQFTQFSVVQRLTISDMILSAQTWFCLPYTCYYCTFGIHIAICARFIAHIYHSVCIFYIVYRYRPRFVAHTQLPSPSANNKKNIKFSSFVARQNRHRNEIKSIRQKIKWKQTSTHIRREHIHCMRYALIHCMGRKKN